MWIVNIVLLMTHNVAFRSQRICHSCIQVKLNNWISFANLGSIIASFRFSLMTTVLIYQLSRLYLETLVSVKDYQRREHSKRPSYEITLYESFYYVSLIDVEWSTIKLVFWLCYFVLCGLSLALTQWLYWRSQPKALENR